VGIDCFTDYYSRALKELNARDVRERGVDILNLDLAEDDIRAAVDGVEMIYHLAAQPGISDKIPFGIYLRNNAIATHRLLEATRGSNSLRCFINISTSSVYGYHATDPESAPPKPASYYGVTKLAAEQLALSYCRQGLLPVCSLRLFSVYGPRERPEKLYSRLIRSILENSEFPLCEGSEKHLRSFTFIDDIVDGFMAVLAKLDLCIGEVFNIGSDVESSTAHGIALTEEILGRKVRSAICPPRSGDQLRTCANIDKARRLLGYKPRWSLRDGLEKQVEWFEQEIHGKL
jgi:nucleoside-diphosphate-sugar epimerase